MYFSEIMNKSAMIIYCNYNMDGFSLHESHACIYQCHQKYLYHAIFHALLCIVCMYVRHECPVVNVCMYGYMYVCTCMYVCM